MLDRRGIALDESTRSRVLACADGATLDAWLDRAATASTIADVFGDATA